MRRRRRIRELEQQLVDERERRHEAEIAAAAARGELRGFRSATDTVSRAAARIGEPFTTAREGLR